MIILWFFQRMKDEQIIRIFFGKIIRIPTMHIMFYSLVYFTNIIVCSPSCFLYVSFHYFCCSLPSPCAFLINTWSMQPCFLYDSLFTSLFSIWFSSIKNLLYTDNKSSINYLTFTKLFKNKALTRKCMFINNKKLIIIYILKTACMRIISSKNNIHFSTCNFRN